MYSLRLLRSGEDPLQDTIKIKFENFSENDVHDLKKEYAALRGLSSPVGLRLFKIDIPPEKFKDTELRLSDDNVLLNNNRLDYYWPNGAESIINVFVTHAGTEVAPSRIELNEELTSLQNLERMQERTLVHIGTKNSSTWAQPSNFATLQETPDVAIMNGRPSKRNGLPIGLYHPVFDKFLSRLETTDLSSIPSRTRTKFLENLKNLLSASPAIYGKETGTNGRDKTIRGHLSELLGFAMDSVDLNGAKPDGVVSGSNGAVYMVIEVKNEIGTGGSDPTIQGAISYVKHWGAETKRLQRYASCCPSFILAIAGPWMCLLGAVMLTQPVVQPLTDFIWVAAGPRSDRQFCRLAKFFWAMKLSISDLENYYSSLPLELATSRFYPYVLQYSMNGQITKFTYIRQLGDPGTSKTIFHARTIPACGSPKDIVVKFSETYNGYAHRLLSDLSLAPELLFDGSTNMEAPRPSGRVMIVMEYIQARDLTKLGFPVPESVYSSVKKAVEVLHAHDIVFGDLRHPNVLAREDEQGEFTGMLIDFDWCGVHEQSRYPHTMNTGISWAEGMGEGELMKKEHDVAMLELLV
ncbi:WaaY domain-containing protein [Ceratobasidium sp. AG-Ba]|nr:WaaY domain-containing protein [Ceratobasidium sp. AG-Ba]QRV99672.1 WaaY domain-containing protein [Ceratobasidium sp. AG-Ba]QRW14213.1 WaaY domain-containing protein [Ceratobasidium sp. AG-Ba]